MNLAMEPFLNPKALATLQVPDGVFEPFRFCLAFLATARLHGAVVRTYTEVAGLICSGKSVTGVKARTTGRARLKPWALTWSSMRRVPGRGPLRPWRA